MPAPHEGTAYVRLVLACARLRHALSELEQLGLIGGGETFASIARGPVAGAAAAGELVAALELIAQHLPAANSGPVEGGSREAQEMCPDAPASPGTLADPVRFVVPPGDRWPSV